jgi:DtxR family Mn-dependent transcriptional regulator
MTTQPRRRRCIARYLDVIWSLERRDGSARVKNIACELGLTKGSVSGALKILKERGLISYQPYRPIRLTTLGRDLAESITGRNRILHRFFTEVLDMDSKVSTVSARRMGPVVDDAVVEHMRRFLFKRSHWSAQFDSASELTVSENKNSRQ